VLLKRQVHPGSYAYSLGTSPVNCARRHLGSRWLIKVDIHDFFESISERRVYFAFRECGYQPLVSFELARICTKISHGQSSREERWQSVRQRDPPGLPPYKSDTLGHLPQGAPTSPMLSNLVSEGLDRALQSVADRHGLVYTRYSDDVIFSTASSNFSRTNAWHLVTEVERIFAAFGHELHRRKITIAPPGARKIALGLLVNGNSLRLSRELRSRISDHVRGIEKFGVAHHARHRHFASLWGLIRHVQGLLSHAAAIEPTFAAPLKSRLDAALIAQGWPPPT
jgi:RNA-directed DNA polymerase